MRCSIRNAQTGKSNLTEKNCSLSSTKSALFSGKEITNGDNEAEKEDGDVNDDEKDAVKDAADTDNCKRSKFFIFLFTL